MQVVWDAGYARAIKGCRKCTKCTGCTVTQNGDGDGDGRRGRHGGCQGAVEDGWGRESDDLVLCPGHVVGDPCDALQGGEEGQEDEEEKGRSGDSWELGCLSLLGMDAMF